MKTFEIVTRVVVHDEAAVMAAAQRQADWTQTSVEIQTPADALEELSHLGEMDDDPDTCLTAPLDCGVEVLKRHVREVNPCGSCGRNATSDPKPYLGTCEKCGARNVSLHVWQPEEGGEDHVCQKCLLGLDKPTTPIPGFPVGGTKPLFPRSVAVEHAGELRQMLADLLEWGARTGMSYEGKIWREAKALMTRIRDEEDEARKAGR